jgi:hypothetical protein
MDLKDDKKAVRQAISLPLTEIQPQSVYWLSSQDVTNVTAVGLLSSVGGFYSSVRRSTPLASGGGRLWVTSCRPRSSGPYCLVVLQTPVGGGDGLVIFSFHSWYAECGRSWRANYCQWKSGRRPEVQNAVMLTPRDRNDTTPLWCLNQPLYNPVVTIHTTEFKKQIFYVLPTHCIYAFSVDLRTNSDYFPIQH